MDSSPWETSAFCPKKRRYYSTDKRFGEDDIILQGMVVTLLWKLESGMGGPGMLRHLSI